MHVFGTNDSYWGGTKQTERSEGRSAAIELFNYHLNLPSLHRR